MAQRRTSPRRHAGATSGARDAAAERWLLLIGVIILLVIVAMLAPWPFPKRIRDGAVPMTMAQARASNAAVPIEARRRIRAAPYRFRGSATARAEAVDCLATAALYEAGADARGQQAVIQVILNRARARGFPRTICGVVYQGYARITGCQFSFTCDGSVARRPVRRGWSAARRTARRALAGRVFADVGGATHYHANWMVPYWRNSLTKIARVGTHLFYVRR
ncbi:cell wall hydrolase [Sphingomonas sp. PB4P5]|uniref:cell wall hydrolase n=1 Tax=Parasphingomonas puruogangriensis TaxID=3096155 RepID=UPI002FC820FC